MTQYIYILGGDVSRWQGLWKPDVAAAAGWEFVYLRMGSIDNVSGQCYVDFRFEENIAKTPPFMDIGLYFYFRANHDVVRQADFIATYLDRFKDEVWFRGFDLDVEVSGGLLQAALAGRIKQCLDLVEQKTDVRPGIYTRASFWNPAVGTVSWLVGREICVARYRRTNLQDEPDLFGPWSDSYLKLLGAPAWHRWQFSADGNLRGPKYGAESPSIDLQLERRILQ